MKSKRWRWALFSRYDIPDIADQSRTYLTRWRLIQTPWFGVYLHAIRLPDWDRNLHDHPWSFGTLILRGGYVEKRLPDERYPYHLPPEVTGRGIVEAHRDVYWPAGSFHRIKITEPHGEFHAISLLTRQPTWTLMLVGPRVRDWGYATDQGWIDHETYHRERGFDEGK